MHITPNTPLEDLPQFLTPKEFCAFTRIGRSTIYDAIRRGEIPVARFGRVVRIPRDVVRRYLTGTEDGKGQTYGV
jgi:excisionase family DNA binding protein